MQTTPPEIASLVERGALFVINHSGGKDSQAMTIRLQAIIPAGQLVIIHADLPEVDWPGIVEHIERYHPGLPLHVCRATKTFFGMVEHRGMFPSPKNRQCTSDLKRGPIERTIRQICRDTGRHIIVNCMGMRADESPGRSKLRTFKFNDSNSKAGREWYDWLPVHDMSTAEVFTTIAQAGQRAHPAYEAGMSRLSCCFCIMSNRADLVTAARLQPALFERYVSTERRLDQTMMMPVGGVRKFLNEIVAEVANAEPPVASCGGLA